MADEREVLADRLRRALADEPTTREMRMFGGLSFLVNDKIVVAAQRDGGLLVRVDPARNSELIGRPGASQPEMGRGRSMGPGWIRVSGDAIGSDEELAFWLRAAMEFQAGGRA